MAQQQHLRTPLDRQVSHLPDQPGIYQFFDAQGQLLYVGKALSLRKRVASYFRAPSQLGARIAKMMAAVARLEIQVTTSEAEALLLEAQLIKACKPRHNVLFSDDKMYPMLKLTHEPYPRLVVARRRAADGARYYGPYTEPALMHEAVQFLRRVFPLRTCRRFPKSPCLEYHLGQCLAPCVQFIRQPAYDRIVEDLAAFLEGKRDRLLRDLSRRMQRAARDQQFEEAARLRNQIQALTSVIVAKARSLTAGPLEQLQGALKLAQLPRRIEAFDISNLFGDQAVGSMVVFREGKPYKAHYRHFRIKTVQGIDDYQMMREVVRRRYSGTLAAQLPLPDLVLVDGGKGQLAAACGQLEALALKIPAIGLAKRFEHIVTPEQEAPIVLLPTSPVLHLIQHVRDEAHRFAITHHRQLRQATVRRSVLDDIAGIGPRRKVALLRAFGSLKALAVSSTEEIAHRGQLPLRVAARIRERLQ
jgi:excinuclease ABC subunit C